MIREIEQPENPQASTKEKNIEGFEMVEEKAAETTVDNLGVCLAGHGDCGGYPGAFVCRI